VGTTQDLQRWQRTLLAIIVVVLASTGVVTYRLIHQLRAANQSVSYAHAERVIATDGLETAVLGRSASARGYLLSGDPVFLDQRQAMRAELQRLLPELHAHGVTESTDIEVRRDDEVVPLHVVAAPVHDARGDLMYAVAGFQDVRELQRLAMRDSLTGLPNRAAISQIYAREQAVSTRARRPFAIALVDFDRFKAINDTHGHAVGDDVLRRTAAAVVGSLRRSDAVARWGGEELVVLLPNTDANGAGHALEKSLASVRALAFVGHAGATFSITFSAGAVAATQGESLEDAVTRADVLLYEAKRAGRNRVHVSRSP
jgi:diguanylate cyclase (GGDEF)-like protein